MHRRLVAIGRAAAAYGKFAAARDSLEAAGQWAELMPLCALQGDFDAIRDYAARVSGTQVRPKGSVRVVLCCLLVLYMHSGRWLRCACSAGQR